MDNELEIDAEMARKTVDYKFMINGTELHAIFCKYDNDKNSKYVLLDRSAKVFGCLDKFLHPAKDICVRGLEERLKQINQLLPCIDTVSKLQELLHAYLCIIPADKEY